MQPIKDQFFLVALSIISYCSKRQICDVFFKWPSTLVKLLETMNKIANKLCFCSAFKSYFLRRYQEIMITFNINLSTLIIEKFRVELPDLFIPVVRLVIESLVKLLISVEEICIHESEQEASEDIKMHETFQDQKTRIKETLIPLLRKYKTQLFKPIINSGNTLIKKPGLLEKFSSVEKNNRMSDISRQ